MATISVHASPSWRVLAPQLIDDARLRADQNIQQSGSQSPAADASLLLRVLHDPVCLKAIREYFFTVYRAEYTWNQSDDNRRCLKDGPLSEDRRALWLITYDIHLGLYRHDGIILWLSDEERERPVRENVLAKFLVYLLVDRLVTAQPNGLAVPTRLRSSAIVRRLDDTALGYYVLHEVLGVAAVVDWIKESLEPGNWTEGALLIDLLGLRVPTVQRALEA